MLSASAYHFGKGTAGRCATIAKNRRHGRFNRTQSGMRILSLSLSMVLALPLMLYSNGEKWGTRLWHLMK
jgi:hypothetical protein